MIVTPSRTLMNKLLCAMLFVLLLEKNKTKKTINGNHLEDAVLNALSDLIADMDRIFLILIWENTSAGTTS